MATDSQLEKNKEEIKLKALEEAKKNNLNEEQTKVFVDEYVKTALNETEKTEKNDTKEDTKQELKKNEKADKKENKKMKKFIVHTPVENYNGEVAGVQFAYGKAEVKPGWILNWFKEHGYKVEEVSE